MSILIKGMEMPKGCDDCPLYGIDLRCSITYTPNYTDGRFVERLGNCPLVAVPPHGRLIDADALTNKLQELYDKRECEARYTDSKEIKVSWNEAVYQIIKAPTIIEAEE